MLNRRKVVSFKNICTVEIGDTVGSVGEIFSDHPFETIFVVDRERHLQGIITMGDYFRKAVQSKSIDELMNKSYKKIEVDPYDKISDYSSQSVAEGVFNKLHKVRKIPVVDGGKLLYAIDREFEAVYEHSSIYTGGAALTSYDSDTNKAIANPLVRVFVTTYNNAEFARNNLHGIMMQKTDFPFEVYIYDDCSTDGTSDIVREYADKHPNIITDIQPENLYSKDKAQRTGIIWHNLKSHSCKYLAVCDGDDYWIDPNKLQMQIDFLEKNNEFSVCSGGYVRNNCFTGEQSMVVLESHDTVGVEYDFSTIYIPMEAAMNFTRVYRVDAMPDYKIAERYDLFTDNHIAYYVLNEGKGFYFSRLLGVHNVHQGGVFDRLDECGKINFLCKTFEGIYQATRDAKAISNLLLFFGQHIAKCTKSKEEQEALYQRFVRDFPELAGEIYKP
jgi:glycosyltransferase involved in cell wall biosynthesis